MNLPFESESIDPSVLAGRKIAVLGYGNQGRAQALNLRDSGQDVVVGGRPGNSLDRATEDRFPTLSLREAAEAADVMMITLPDQHASGLINREIVPALRDGQTVLFSHGYAVVFGDVEWPAFVDIALVAPKGAGYGVRAAYERDSGVPGLVGVWQDASGRALATALAYAWGIGCHRQFILPTTFREETVCDLFGEQAVLCGGIPALITAGFNTLVEAGYSPEVAYFECLHETKLIVDLLVAKGISGMREAISDTAAYGGLRTGTAIVDDRVQANLKSVLQRIESGEFAQEWNSEAASGSPNYSKLRSAEADAPIERVGKAIRHRLK